MTAQTAAEQMWAWITGKSRGAHLGYPRAWEEWFDAEGKFRADPGQQAPIGRRGAARFIRPFGLAKSVKSRLVAVEPIAEGVAADLFCDYCQLTRRWGLMVSGLADYDLTEVLLACPLLSAEDHAQGISDGEYFFFYSTEAEMWAVLDRHRAGRSEEL